jgi:hypothetical protein
MKPHLTTEDLAEIYHLIKFKKRHLNNLTLELLGQTKASNDIFTSIAEQDKKLTALKNKLVEIFEDNL